MEREHILTSHQRDKFATPLSISLLTIGLMSTPIIFIIFYSSLRLLRFSKKQISVDLKISFGILIIDLVISISLIIVGAMSNFLEVYITTSEWYCSFTLIFYNNQTYISIYWVGLLSIERGLLIIHNIKLSDKFWLTVMLGELIYFLALSSIGISMQALGVVNNGYACMILPNFDVGQITTFSYLVLMLINFACMIYCYIGISIKLRIKAYNDIQQLNLNKEQTLRQTNRTICKVIAILVLYIGINSLELINLLIEVKTEVTRPSLSDLISTNLISIEPIINSLILVQFHESVKLSLVESFPMVGKMLKVSKGSLNQNQPNNPESV
ncbi:hypothetical protein CONCODRAFT_9272 [Conidiobolus coronatus NRRL 28638]|uniref:G-protein coupled receptors family 1 profile domain-containing protein n=1 Tax=Conidiobolus coronatus (strain ATCC 28846 / CBS 209.66 / NRRL 28638) TaxID=796925 RepID=A0A137P0Q1_CONC2|nr:hypothetical protein CONCODRAFT_9272 [Conidiobolus coronatus NRRL 28638]|eukprot:KXN68471.1 hypothetical protein CONCODRAFT_9272 [Conidiobolus coronatus NRRL 28638]